tara:strand:+ start:2104 stop:2556 length:453 start_codon:yes stop_codon:yes gene_type:complete
MNINMSQILSDAIAKAIADMPPGDLLKLRPDLVMRAPDIYNGDGDEQWCDCCGQIIDGEEHRFSDHETIDDGRYDCAGFWLCDRKECIERRDSLPTAERWKLYALGRRRFHLSDLPRYAHVYMDNARRLGVEEWVKDNLPAEMVSPPRDN